MNTFTAHQIADHFAHNTEFELTIPADATGVRWDNGWTECLEVVETNWSFYGLDEYADSTGEFIFDRPGRCDMHRDLDKMADEHSGDCPLGA